MIITPPISGKGGRKSQPVEDTIYREAFGVEVIVVVGAVYNGPDHKNLNNGKPCQPGDRIVIAQANAQRLIDAGMVRLPTVQDDQPVEVIEQSLADMIKDALIEKTTSLEAAKAEPTTDEDEWLDWTPIMDAGVPESIARGLYEQGYTSKAKMIDAYLKRGEDALLVVVGMGPSRVRKVLSWLGISE